MTTHPIWTQFDIIELIFTYAHEKKDDVLNRRSMCDWNLALCMFAVNTACSRAIFEYTCNVYNFAPKQAVAFLNGIRGANCFITGAAGTGKSHVVDCICEAVRSMSASGDLRAQASGIQVLAPTGPAAINVGGNTIHSFLRLRGMLIPPENRKKKLTIQFHQKQTSNTATETGEYETEEDADSCESIAMPLWYVELQEKLSKHRMLIIDEISMAHELLMAQLEFVIGKVHGSMHPFQSTVSLQSDGSRIYVPKKVQLVLVGDFAQLPPVVPMGTLCRRAFDSGQFQMRLFLSTAWRRWGLHTCELDVVKRSGHGEYAALLSRLREGEHLRGDLLEAFRRITRPARLAPGQLEEDMALFSRVNPPKNTHPKLALTSPCVNTWNERKMTNFQGESVTLQPICTLQSDDPSSLPPSIHCGSPAPILLKKGCPVVITKNQWACSNTAGCLKARQVANGTLGRFRGEIDDSYIAIEINRRGDIFEYRMPRDTRVHSRTETFTEVVNRVKRVIKRKYVATSSQYTTKAAFALSAHKIQGQTIHDEPHVVRIDQFWETGALYVLMSRAADPMLIRLVGDPRIVYNQRSNVERMTQEYQCVRTFHAEVRAVAMPFYAKIE